MRRLISAKYFRVRLPVGAKRDLAILAKARYQSTCAVARQAIMAEIEKARPVISPSTVERLEPEAA